MSTVTKQQVLDADFYLESYVFDAELIDYFLKNPQERIINFPRPALSIVKSKALPELAVTIKGELVGLNQNILGDDGAELSKEEMDKIATEIVNKLRK